MDTDHARNLACHRAARSVWQKRGWSGVTIEERVGPWVVSLAGAGLLIAGARDRSWRGVSWMITGATMVGCAAAGLCNPRHAAVQWQRFARRPDGISADLLDSFPASDAPSSSALVVVAI